ncbi:hypothetical protein PMIN01_02208 [Paraphaeosphaeria minitans]|uniref:Uncharacterized protein n=1 Tax=Paraphaeosphaeria minitans TaxID=565426 RepID=A0A9P6GQ89_9PLEO|nr:hypothetical protein PMIN01_02208 [Paraphaeosphaeria minitans]
MAPLSPPIAARMAGYLRRANAQDDVYLRRVLQPLPREDIPHLRRVQVDRQQPSAPARSEQRVLGHGGMGEEGVCTYGGGRMDSRPAFLRWVGTARGRNVMHERLLKRLTCSAGVS